MGDAGLTEAGQADQNERDYTAFSEAIASGRIEAVAGL